MEVYKCTFTEITYDHQWEKSTVTVECKTSFFLVLVLKKKKVTLFPFLFDVSKYKKSQDSYTNYLNETMQSNSSVYNNHPPSVLLLYTTVWSIPENWMACVWLENFTCLQKPNIMQASCYFVSASHFTNLLF